LFTRKEPWDLAELSTHLSEERSHAGRPKAQHNVFLGDAAIAQCLVDGDFGAVVLYPHLAVDDVEVDG
jgi:hypothetical protein